MAKKIKNQKSAQPIKNQPHSDKENVAVKVEESGSVETSSVNCDKSQDVDLEKELDDYLKAQEEANEVFWSFFPDAKEVGNLNELQESVPTFSELEQAEREGNAAEILLREMKEKESQEALLKIKAPSFADLEAAQRRADELFLKLYISENSVTLKEDVSHIMNNETLYSSDAMVRLCDRYREYSREQGVPENVLNLMSDDKFSLIQLMQIKFGYEDGLSIDEISKYARPDLKREEMVVARHELLNLRNLSKEQALGQNQNKNDLDTRILSASSRSRSDASKKNMEMLNRSR